MYRNGIHECTIVEPNSSRLRKFVAGNARTSFGICGAQRFKLQSHFLVMPRGHARGHAPRQTPHGGSRDHPSRLGWSWRGSV